MRRTNWKQPLVILAAFIIGLIVNLSARQILPESLAKGSDLIAVILQVLVAAGIIFITVRVFFREED